ncbi:hypothetical protein B7494_g3947 [Chlorociboria aeruginascens]|nr:hypothetical protein B7494_g3947 [Chlorociboria aeruginascens]
MDHYQAHIYDGNGSTDSSTMHRYVPPTCQNLSNSTPSATFSPINVSASPAAASNYYNSSSHNIAFMDSIQVPSQTTTVPRPSEYVHLAYQNQPNSTPSATFGLVNNSASPAAASNYYNSSSHNIAFMDSIRVPSQTTTVPRPSEYVHLAYQSQPNSTPSATFGLVNNSASPAAASNYYNSSSHNNAYMDSIRVPSQTTNVPRPSGYDTQQPPFKLPSPPQSNHEQEKSKKSKKSKKSSARKNKAVPTEKAPKWMWYLLSEHYLSI